MSPHWWSRVWGFRLGGFRLGELCLGVQTGELCLGVQAGGAVFGGSGWGNTHLKSPWPSQTSHSPGNVAWTHRWGPGHPAQGSHCRMKGGARLPWNLLFQHGEKCFKESLHYFLRPLRHSMKISSLTHCRCFEYVFFPGGCVLTSIIRGFWAEAQSQGTQGDALRAQTPVLVPAPPHCITQPPWADQGYRLQECYTPSYHWLTTGEWAAVCRVQ